MSSFGHVVTEFDATLVQDMFCTASSSGDAEVPRSLRCQEGDQYLQSTTDHNVLYCCKSFVSVIITDNC